MSDDQNIDDLRAKLEQKDEEFESYKQECKQIEAMLEDDCQKKQQELKQLKEQSIKRDKGEKMLKIQVSQLEAQVENLKSQIAESTAKPEDSAQARQQLEDLKKAKSQLQQKNTELNSKLEQLTKQNSNITEQLKSLQKQIQTAKNQKPIQKDGAEDALKYPSSQFENQIKKLNAELQKKNSEIKKIKSEYEQKLKKSEQAGKKQSSVLKAKQQQKIRRPSVTKTGGIDSAQHNKQIEKYKQSIHKLEQKCEKFQKSQKELRHTVSMLNEQKYKLSNKVKSKAQQLERQKRNFQVKLQKEQNSLSEQKNGVESSETNTGMIMIQDASEPSSLSFSCLLLTKRHYISPFIEVKDKNLKLFKNTKTGFEKSLGAMKHKLDWIGYDNSQIIENTVTKIKSDSENSHCVIIYGAKRTGKKYMMAEIIEKVKEHLQSKLEEASQQQQIKITFMKRSADDSKNYLKEGSSKEDIQGAIQEVLALGQKKSDKKSKKNSKPKVRYFCLSIGQVSWQVITSSCLNPFIKNNETFSDYLNNIVFSKLNNVLQSSMTNHQIILTVNPIVSLYQQCKNTLSITLVPNRESGASPSRSDRRQWNIDSSPSQIQINREDLTDLTKKKIDSIEKQSQQASLKIKKIQDECYYYRMRFEELQIRLKNLINTHHDKNSYLKKSPVTLSYEKLLKFTSTVLGRNTTFNQSRTSFSPTHVLQDSSNEINIEEYIEEDAKSLDGY